MSLNFNKVLLGGRITNDLELKQSQSGNNYANFSIAVNEKTSDTEKTTFVRCVAFGKSAEFLCNYFNKGKAVFIEGRLDVAKRPDKEGVEREYTNIIADRINFVESASAGGNGGGQYQQPQVQQAQAQFQQQPKQQKQQGNNNYYQQPKQQPVAEFDF